MIKYQNCFIKTFLSSSALKTVLLSSLLVVQVHGSEIASDRNFNAVARVKMAKEVINANHNEKEIQQIASSYQVDYKTLKNLADQYVTGGNAALATGRKTDLQKFSDSWVGTWELVSRIAKGQPTNTNAVMIFTPKDALMIETGTLDQIVESEMANGSEFRLASYTTVSDKIDSTKMLVTRTFNSEMIGSYGEYSQPNGIFSEGSETYGLKGESFVHMSTPATVAEKVNIESSTDIHQKLSTSKSEGDEHHNVTTIVGDSMILYWSSLDLMDTYRRVKTSSIDSLLGKEGASLEKLWIEMKASNKLQIPEEISLISTDKSSHSSFSKVDRMDSILSKLVYGNSEAKQLN